MGERPPKVAVVLGELLIITCGVLIALGVDQAVQGIGERRREADYLNAFREEIEADLRSLREPLEEALAEREAAAEQIIAAIDGANVDGPMLLAALDRAGHLSLFTPRRATYDDVVSTGNLHLIRDSSVRAALIAYYEGAGLDSSNELIRQEIWFGYRSALDDVLDPIVMAEVTRIEDDDTESTIEEFASRIPPDLAQRGLRLEVLRESARFRAGVGSALEYTHFQRRQFSGRIGLAENTLNILRNARND